MRIAPALLAASSLVATAAVAADAPIDQPLAWIRAPSAAEVAAADASHAKGKAILDCKIQPDGRLRACKAISEEPAGQGLGKAAEGLAGKFTGYTTSERTEREVQIPVAFNDDTGTPKIVIGPGVKDYQAIITKAAADKSVTKADVTLDCKVGDKGVMAGCTAASESPKGLGIGDLAVQMGPKFISTLWGANGRPTMGASVRIPLEVAIRDDNNIAAATVINARRGSEISADLVADSGLQKPLERYYPERAANASQPAEVMLKCKATSAGALSDCDVSTESPGGMGFGAGAKKIAEHLALKSGTAVKPADGVVLLPFSFRSK